MPIAKTLYVSTRRAWRAWLRRHHASAGEAWLIYYKKESGRPRIPYDDAVEEALCFGWIDSIVKRIDDRRFAQRFSPRREGSAWSPSNISRMRRLIRERRVTKAGVRVFDPSRQAAPPPKRPERIATPAVFSQALRSDSRARVGFEALSPLQQRRYLHWIATAKREETRQRRTAEAMALLRAGRGLGLK
jgi:uncharacterized protein YdeI (YjbR/CyaY-like superfamily)